MPATQVSNLQVFARIALESGLVGDTYQKRNSPALLTTALGGIRCDRLEQAHLILASRFPEYEPDMLTRALQERRTLVRTWGVRGVLQIVPTSQLSLYLAAAGITAPRWKRFLDARSNLTTPARLRLLRRLCPEIISREALRDAIPDATTRLFMLREAAQAGHILWREGDGQQATFVWTESWLGKSIEPDREYHELVGRYLTSFGPVEASDLAGWLGVTVAAARKLMAKHLVEEVEVEGDTAPSFMKRDDLTALQRTRKSKAKGIVVVPPGDPFLLAYRTRFRREGEANEDEGVVLRDTEPVAAWSLNRGVVSLSWCEPEVQKRVEKEIRTLVTRAGLEAEFKTE